MLILTVMIAPIMIAVFSDGLRAVPRGWIEGSLALGVNRWRTFWKVAVRTARPALVAGTVLATARALGRVGDAEHGLGRRRLRAESRADGLIFLFEPSQPLAATILRNTDELCSPPMKHTLYAIAARAAVLRGDAVGDRLGRQAADEALLLRGGERMSTTGALAPKPQPPVATPESQGERDHVPGG